MEVVCPDLEKSAPRRLRFAALPYCGPKPTPEHSKVLVAFCESVVLSENGDETGKEGKDA